MWYSWKVDLERTSKGFLVAQELEERMVILCSPSDKIHGITISDAELHVLTAIIKPFAKFLRDKEIGGFDSCLTT